METLNRFLYLQSQGLINKWQYFPFLIDIMLITFCYLAYIKDNTESKRLKVCITLLTIISIGIMTSIAISSANAEINHVEARQKTVLNINKKITNGYEVYIQSDLKSENVNQVLDYQCKYEDTQKYRYIINESNKTISIIFK